MTVLALVMTVDAEANIHGMPAVPDSSDDEQDSETREKDTKVRMPPPNGLYGEPAILLGGSWGTGKRQPGGFIHRLGLGMHFAVAEHGPAFRIGLVGELSIDETPKNYSAIGAELAAVMRVNALWVGPRVSIMAPYSADRALAGGLRVEWKAFVGGFEVMRVVGGLNQSRDAYGAHVLFGVTGKPGGYAALTELVVGAVVGLAIASAIPY